MSKSAIAERKPELPIAEPQIAPLNVRYIKLGSGGTWEHALDQAVLPWGSKADPHHLAKAGDWLGAEEAYRAGRSVGVATAYLRELREFYTLGADTLWITFARDHLWWAFAEPAVEIASNPGPAEPSAFRRTVEPWRNTDINGRLLRTADISSRITKVAAYQQTICNPDPVPILQLINAIPDPRVQEAIVCRDAMVAATARLVELLHQADLELLVDLLFREMGWRRVSTLGGTMKTNDLVLEQPATRERANVQVKSTANKKVLDDCVATFLINCSANRFYFIHHTGLLRRPPEAGPTVEIWGGAELAARVVDHGLLGWVMARAA